jgi:ribonuclease P protein component
MNDCRLLKTEILRKKTELNQVFTSAKILSSPNLTLRYIQSPSRKIGFIINKGIVPKAVMRNKLKRYLREIYRNNKEYFKENYSYVLQARRGAVNKNLIEMKEEVLSLVQQINNGKK